MTAAIWALSMLVSFISEWSYCKNQKKKSLTCKQLPPAASVIHWFTRGIFTNFLPYAKHCNLTPQRERSSIVWNVPEYLFPILQTISSWSHEARLECHTFRRLPLLIQTWAQASSSEKPFLTILSKISSWVCMRVCTCTWVNKALAPPLTMFHFFVSLLLPEIACLFTSLFVHCLSNLEKNKLCKDRDLVCFVLARTPTPRSVTER